MKNFKIVLAVAALYFVGCTQKAATTTRAQSNVKGLSANEKGGNVALLFETNFEPAYGDLPRLKTVLTDSQAHYGFDVKTRQNSTKAEVLNDIAENVKSVGSDGTLFLYLAGHGSPNGYLQTQDDDFMNFADVKKAIQKGRSTPFRRLVVFVFSCYAGNWIEGSSSPVSLMTSNVTNDLRSGANADGGLYSEVIVMTSSNAEEESWSDGEGTEFGSAISKGFASLKSAANEITNKTFLDKVVAGVSSSKPQYKTIPESLVNEPLLNTPGGGNPPTSTPTGLSYGILLGAANADSSAMMTVATDTNVESAAICSDSSSACTANPAQVTSLVASNLVINGRKVFQTDKALPLHAGPMTLYFYGANKSMLAAKQIKISAKQ